MCFFVCMNGLTPPLRYGVSMCGDGANDCGVSVGVCEM